MVVNRSILSAMINNKALHDFYNINGVEVANLKGKIWKQYGDGNLNSRFSDWKSKQSYYEIEYPEFTQETERIFEAVSCSLIEIFSAFKSARENPQSVRIIKRIPDEQAEIPSFILSEFKALSIIPIPFNTDVTNYHLPADNLEQIKKNTQFLKNWSFIKSRVANSIILALYGDWSTGAEGWMTAEARMVFGSTYYSYNYNLDGTKTWTFDKWFGTTLSYGAGWHHKASGILFHTFQGGLSYNFDLWVSDSRFIGIYGFVEAGMMRLVGVDRLMFSPSIGLQLGSLIGIPYYEWPVWTRIPIQFLLPLKLRYSYSFIGGGLEKEQFVIELDLVF